LGNGVRSILSLAQKWAVVKDATEAPINLPDADGNLDWEVHYVDGSVIRAHQHAAGALMGS